MGTGKRFHVALSFPGERRAFVHQVAEHLGQTLGPERVLYDAWYEAELARPDLDTYLQALYHDQSDLICVFLCADYERREWCGLEWRALRDLIKRRQDSAIMPLRFDLTEIPGLFSTDGYVWLGDGRDPAEVARLILQRWKANSGAPAPGSAPVQPPRIDLTHLPAGAEHFLGREAELAALDAAWHDGGQTAVCELIAPGGTGKTALVKRWLAGVRAAGWGGAQRVYAWSFYSQGTGDDRQASEDHFLATALGWFGVDLDPATHPADKGRALAEVIRANRTLLILDGCEPLQYPPGPLAGGLRAPGLKRLLTHLASAGQPGLCVLTSREWLQDVAEWVRGPGRPDGPVLRLDLGNLDPADGARLLHTLGADRAGVAGIGPDDPELRAASGEVRGHALTLSLLGRYLALAEGGDIRRRDRVDLAAASEATGGHAFRVMAAYETWLRRAGEAGARELAALRLLGYFDRPAGAEDLAALRAAPPIPGLTEALFAKPGGWLGFLGRRTQPISDRDWVMALKRLEQAGLVAPGRVDGRADPGPSVTAHAPGWDARAPLDAHPLVREYLAAALEGTNPAAFREGHRRLYERLKTSAPYRPEGLAGLQPLYQAVAHGCLAGLWREVCVRVYRDRILRGTRPDGFYSIKKLGAFGADLAAIACLFAEPWSRPAPSLREGDQAWLLNEAATRLRALGRLGEALGPMRAGAEMRVKQGAWTSAAIIYGNLSELQLTLGLVPEAVADARRSLEHADRSGHAAQRFIVRAILADALHQQGETEEALAGFAEAEAMQAELQPQYPLLYSVGGFRYYDLLLAGAERAAWSVAGGGSGGAGNPAVSLACTAVAGRARQTLEWEKGMSGAPIVDFALHHLTLARCALYADLLARRPPGAEAQAQARRALDGLRVAGQLDHLPSGLLTRAWLRQTQGDTAGAEADLAEAEQIASRGGMTPQTQKVTSCSIGRLRSIVRDRCLTCAASGNIHMTHAALYRFAESRTPQRSSWVARGRAQHHAGLCSTGRSLRPISPSGLPLRAGGAGADGPGTSGGAFGRGDVQAASGFGEPCTRAGGGRPDDDQRDGVAGAVGLSFRPRRPWRVAATAPALSWSWNTPLTVCSGASWSRPTRSWCPSRRVSPAPAPG
jgi:tetratricopeptide (TPR) repeat protein